MREAFALQKLSNFFKKQYWRISNINISIFNETLTNDVVSFEQPGPVHIYNQNDYLKVEFLFHFYGCLAVQTYASIATLFLKV